MNLGITVQRPPLSENPEALRRALVDSGALVRMARVWELRVSVRGGVSWRRIGKKR